jgi:hypothetical protein
MREIRTWRTFISPERIKKTNGLGAEVLYVYIPPDLSPFLLADSEIAIFLVGIVQAIFFRVSEISPLEEG